MNVGTPKEVAALLRVSVDTVYKMSASGELPTLRKVGGQLRFDLDAVEAWLRDNEGAAA